MEPAGQTEDCIGAQECEEDLEDEDDTENVLEHAFCVCYIIDSS